MKRRYDKKDDIPKGLESVYEEKNGGWELKPIEGLKPIEEFQSVQNELTTLKTTHSELEKKFEAFKDWDAKDVQSKLDKYNEYETKGKFKDSKDDDTKLNELVIVKTAELNREIKRLSADLEKATKDRDVLKQDKIKGLLEAKLEEAIYDKTKNDYKVYPAVKKDIIKNALDDLEYIESVNDFRTKDDKKLTIGEWLDPLAKERLWYKGSRGDADPGSGNKLKPGNEETHTVQDVISEIWEK